MNQINKAIRLRLSAAQVSVIWPGLDLLIKSYVSRQTKGGIRYEYPFRAYPPRGGFYLGKFNQAYKDKTFAVWKCLRPKAKTGGRIQMDTIELRAVIFAIRANLDFVRKRRRDLRRESPAVKARFLVDNESYAQLKIESRRVIHSLENHVKRANRALQKAVPLDEYRLLMDAWSAHLRWMRVHITYFMPLPRLIQSRRIRQRKDLDDLMLMAERGIRNQGYEPPESKELRRMMRLYARYSRRRRTGTWGLEYLLNRKQSTGVLLHLARFVLRRMELKELPEL